MILKRSLLLPLGVFLVAALALLARCSISRPTATTGAARVPIGGPFALTTQDGAKFSSESLKGKPFAIFFGFTHCPEVCPTTLFDLTQDLEALGPDAAKMNVVFITVDPERDTPELMKTYLSSFDPRIVGLTGTDAEIAAAAKEYKIYYKKVPTDSGYTMDHTATIFLMDSRGDFFGSSNFQEPEQTRREKLKRLVAGRLSESQRAFPPTCGEGPRVGGRKVSARGVECRTPSTDTSEYPIRCTRSSDPHPRPLPARGRGSARSPGFRSTQKSPGLSNRGFLVSPLEGLVIPSSNCTPARRARRDRGLRVRLPGSRAGRRRDRRSCRGSASRCRSTGSSRRPR